MSMTEEQSGHIPDFIPIWIKFFCNDKYFKPGLPKALCDRAISVAEFLWHTEYYFALSHLGSDLFCAVCLHFASDELKVGKKYEDLVALVGIMGTDFGEQFENSLEGAGRQRRAIMATADAAASE